MFFYNVVLCGRAFCDAKLISEIEKCLLRFQNIPPITTDQLKKNAFISGIWHLIETQQKAL